MPDATPAAPAVAPAAPPPAAPAAASPAPAAAPATPAPASGATLLTPPPTNSGTSTPETSAPKTQDAPAPDVELKFPDGFKADPELVTGFKSVAKELGLQSESAQKLADIYVKAQQAQLKSMADARVAESSKWADSARSDQEYGGAKFDESLKVAQKAVAKFGNDALRDALNTSGFGNNPEFVRFMVKVGKAMSEDSVAGAQGATSSTNPKEAVLAAMYPSMFSK